MAKKTRLYTGKLAVTFSTNSIVHKLCGRSSGRIKPNKCRELGRAGGDAGLMVHLIRLTRDG